MIPRIVSSLISSPVRSALSHGILFSLQIGAVAGRGWSRMAADRLPPALILDPYVGQQHAIFDYPAEIFEAPARVHRSHHDVADGGRVADLELDRVDLA